MKYENVNNFMTVTKTEMKESEELHNIFYYDFVFEVKDAKKIIRVFSNVLDYKKIKDFFIVIHVEQDETL